MPLSEGAANTLWAANYKINAGTRGYNFKVQFAGIDEAQAVIRAEDLAARMKKLFPSDAEIMWATLSNSNTTRDATFLRGALGVGEYITAPGPPVVPAMFDTSWTALQIRLETPDRLSVQRIFNPIPDSIMTDEVVQGAIADITSMPVSVPAPGAGLSWYVEFSSFMAALVLYSHYVKSGHQPGGTYQYSAWRKAFMIRGAKKKGGDYFR